MRLRYLTLDSHYGGVWNNRSTQWVDQLFSNATVTLCNLPSFHVLHPNPRDPQLSRHPTQINKKYDILSSAKVCIDLCAAPGGWCQVAAKYMPRGSIILGVDLLPIRPIPNVKTLVHDITTEECRTALKREMQTWKVSSKKSIEIPSSTAGSLAIFSWVTSEVAVILNPLMCSPVLCCLKNTVLVYRYCNRSPRVNWVAVIPWAMTVRTMNSLELLLLIRYNHETFLSPRCGCLAYHHRGTPL